MTDRVLADLVVGAHLLYIAFVVLGGFAVARWPRVAWLHVPAVAWGAAVEWLDLWCPLTPLENRFRVQAGERGYAGDFVDRYLLRAIYPEGLTREIQLALGVGVVALNVAVYVWIWRRRGRDLAGKMRLPGSRFVNRDR